MLTAALSVAMVHVAEASVRNGGQTAYNDAGLIIGAFLEYFQHGRDGISQDDAWVWLVEVSTGRRDDGMGGSVLKVAGAADGWPAC